MQHGKGTLFQGVALVGSPLARFFSQQALGRARLLSTFLRLDFGTDAKFPIGHNSSFLLRFTEDGSDMVRALKPNVGLRRVHKDTALSRTLSVKKTISVLGAGALANLVKQMVQNGEAIGV
jgi:hypothetical protein